MRGARAKLLRASASLDIRRAVARAGKSTDFVTEYFQDKKSGQIVCPLHSWRRKAKKEWTRRNHRCGK